MCFSFLSDLLNDAISTSAENLTSGKLHCKKITDQPLHVYIIIGETGSDCH